VTVIDMVTPVELQDWPPTMRSIAQAIGVEGALLMVQELGGLEYYIPRTAPEHHPLVQLLGAVRFAVLAGRHGGSRVAVPRDVGSNLAKGRIFTLAEQGLDQRSIARRVGVTQRYVRRVLESVPQRPLPSDPRQLPLTFR
jgi:hypothetical protein